MAGFSITATFGLDSSGLKKGVAEAESAVASGSKRMQRDAERIGTGFERSASSVSLNARKFRKAVSGLALNLASGGDVSSTLSIAAANLAGSVRGAFGIMVGAQVFGGFAKSAADALGKVKELNKAVSQLVFTGMNAGNASSESLFGQLGKVAETIKAQHDDSSLMDTFTNMIPAVAEGKQKALVKSKEEWLRLSKESLSAMEQENETTQLRIAGMNEEADLAEARLKTEEKINVLRRQLDSYEVPKDRVDAITDELRKAGQLNEQQIKNKYAAEATAKATREAAEAEREQEVVARRVAEMEARQANVEQQKTAALRQQAEGIVAAHENPGGTAEARRHNRAVNRAVRAIGARERDKADLQRRQGGEDGASGIFNGGLKNPNTDSFFDTGEINGSIMSPISTENNAFFNRGKPDFNPMPGLIPSSQPGPANGGPLGEILSAVKDCASKLSNADVVKVGP